MTCPSLVQLSSDCLRNSEIQFLKSHWIISKQKRINAKFFMELYDTSSISFSGLWFYGRKPCGHMSNLPPWFLAQVEIWQREVKIVALFENVKIRNTLWSENWYWNEGLIKKQGRRRPWHERQIATICLVLPVGCVPTKVPLCKETSEQ